MKRLVIIFLGILIIFQSCLTASKKASRQQNFEYMPNLPYRALNKGVLSKNEPPLDTTFDYKVLEKIIDAALPKNIFGTKAMGTAEFYSMIDTNKHVVDIKLIECEFYKKGHLVYNYKENSKAEADSNLKNIYLSLCKVLHLYKISLLLYHSTQLIALSAFINNFFINSLYTYAFN